MQIQLKKMNTKYENVVLYSIGELCLNNIIGNTLSIKWTGKVKCFCNKIYKSFYRQNFCYKCYWTLPQASQSIIKPELCTAHLGIEERDLEWEKKFQLAPHYVYLANSTGVKVGITRKTQIFTRWMDQGASQAIIFAEVPNRRMSGDIEVQLKSQISDKTNWRKMLSGDPPEVDLINLKMKLFNELKSDQKKYFFDENKIFKINYPVKEYPNKIKSLKLEKENKIEGKVVGIKGQYLIFETGEVFNVRAHEGFIVNLYYDKELKKIPPISL